MCVHALSLPMHAMAPHLVMCCALRRYHNHANYPNFHRPNREPPVKVLSLQGDFRTSDLDIISALKSYCEKHDLEFRFAALKIPAFGRNRCSPPRMQLVAFRSCADSDCRKA